MGATNELQELLDHLDGDEVVRRTAQEGTTWHFNPPGGPHFGGAHEALIKSAKKALYAILPGAEVTDEELATAMTGSEALLNLRPLTYQSADVRDPLPLTPNHFMFSQQGSPFVPEGVDQTVFSPRKRWRVIQDLVLQFWKRWMRELVPALNPRKKWLRTLPDMKERHRAGCAA